MNDATYIFCLKFSKTTENEIFSVATAISSKYLNNVNCLLIIDEFNPEQENIIQYIEFPQLTSKFYISLDGSMQESCHNFITKNIIYKSIEEGCTNFIVQLPDPLCFLRSWKIVAKSSLQRHNPRILVLPTRKNNIISSDILKSNLTEFLLDIIMVDMYPKEQSAKESHFEIITSDLNSKSEILADCTTKECGKSLSSLPNKIVNLNKKVLKVATFNYPPYAILEPLDGTEVRIALEYARVHNCSIEIVTDDHEWGEIYENSSGIGILGNVAQEKADIGFGAVYLWFHEYQFVDFSIPYIRTGITCLAPKPQLLSTVLLPIRPFKLITWLLVFFILLKACAVLYVVKKLDIYLLGSASGNQTQRHGQWFTTKADTILRTFGFMVLQAYNTKSIESTSIRHLVNWLHIMFMLLATSYSSGLASILTVPSYEPPVDTVTDLVNSQLQWGATHDAWIFSLREATEPKMKTLLSRFRALPKEVLYNNSFKANFAFSVERLPAGHFAVGDYITEESMMYLRLMKQDIYYEHCIIVFQKGSPYLDSFNVLIQRLSASGILLFWEGEVSRKFLQTNVQSAIKESSIVLHRAQLTSIQFSHLLGAFILLSVGLSLAIFSFIVEINISYFFNVYNQSKSNVINVRWTHVNEFYS